VRTTVVNCLLPNSIR